MDDSDYDAAIRQEAALLDKQLAQYVIDALAARQLGGEVALSANVTAAIDAAFVNAAKKVAPAQLNTPPQERSPIQGFGLASVPDKPESVLGFAEVPEQSGGESPTDSEMVDKAVAPVKGEPRVDGPKRPWTDWLVLLALLAAIGFGSWQMIRATGFKEQKEARGRLLAADQKTLNEELCAAGYPAVTKAIELKNANNEGLTEAERATLAFDSFRQKVTKANDSRVNEPLACPNNAVAR